MNAMHNRFFEIASDLVISDERVILLFGATGVGIPKNMRSLMKQYPDRIIDAGIMEQAIVSMAAGMAAAGMIPVFYAQSPFIVERAYEQLKIDFGYQKLGGNFIGYGASTEVAAYGPTHCCQADTGVLKLIPGMQIVTPGGVSEFETLLRAEYDNGNPTFFRLTRYENSIKNDVCMGKANVIKTGSQATVVAVGPMLEAVMKAIGDEDITVLYYASIMPFDEDTLRRNFVNNRVLLCEPYYYGALSTNIMTALKGELVKMDYVGMPLEFVSNYGFVSENAEYFGFTEQQIRDKLKTILR